jgi:hypothetical protein
VPFSRTKLKEKTELDDKSLLAASSTLKVHVPSTVLETSRWSIDCAGNDVSFTTHNPLSHGSMTVIIFGEM